MIFPQKHVKHTRVTFGSLCADEMTHLLPESFPTCSLKSGVASDVYHQQPSRADGVITHARTRLRRLQT